MWFPPDHHHIQRIRSVFRKQERAVITVQNGPFVAGAILTAEQINEAIDALQGARDALTMDMEDAS